MQQSATAQDSEEALKKGLRLLLCEQGAFLATIDWSCPDDIALAEKRGRIIQVHRGNIEKTLGMDSDSRQDKPDQNDPFGDDVEALRKEVERRLLRHAHALGREELLRRLRQRGFTHDELELEFPGSTGSEGASE
ncbi:MAG: hypothetical protein AAF608_03450 [Pseudomonadota bacterium]